MTFGLHFEKERRQCLPSIAAPPVFRQNTNTAYVQAVLCLSDTDLPHPHSLEFREEVPRTLLLKPFIERCGRLSKDLLCHLCKNRSIRHIHLHQP